jgi:uncharacterized membrane protein YhiD involved in acid resistance
MDKEALFSSSETVSQELLGILPSYLAMSAVLAFALAWHFVRFGQSFSNRRKFARILPSIALTTTLVIAIVKSSLALSLGLVGALSIVRFRTPIKEPEELAYIFLSIAIGLGTGAGHLLPTLMAIGLILIVLAIRSRLDRQQHPTNLYLNIDLPKGETAPTLEDLLQLLKPKVDQIDLRRFDVHPDHLGATFFIDCQQEDALLAVETAVTERYPEATVTFIDQSHHLM